jgi:biopolymer transport protein ExbD
MHKRQKPEVKEDISPNLIPMIDIMFLLLLFFMLGADMGKKEHEALILPIADKIKEIPKEKNLQNRQTTINIHHKDDVGVCPVFANDGICRDPTHWGWAIRGKQYTKETLRPRLEIEAAEAGLENEPGVKKQLSKLKVLIRADAKAPYGDIQKVIERCGEAGIYKIEVGAAKPPEEAKG